MWFSSVVSAMFFDENNEKVKKKRFLSFLFEFAWFDKSLNTSTFFLYNKWTSDCLVQVNISQLMKIKRWPVFQIVV